MVETPAGSVPSNLHWRQCKSAFLAVGHGLQPAAATPRLARNSFTNWPGGAQRQIVFACAALVGMPST